MKTFYVTTPIYYINADPHIGSAYTTFIADVVARYKRFRGYDVFFLTGTDEHGQKVYRSAKKAGVDVKQFTDEHAKRFVKLWDSFDITYDRFIRTTDEKHMKVVQNLFTKMYSNGDIYKGNYEGWYCIQCESYYTDKDAIKKDGERLCPDCGRPLEYISEENYFFRLSKYTKPLLKYFEEHSDFVEPAFRKNEMIRMLQRGLEDISVSRTSFNWGIPFPGDPEHVIYVWVDALINYVSALGYSTEDPHLYEKFWPADLHLIGKEINRFHSLIWPAMLLSVGLPLPKKIYAHGWLTVEGEKISKSRGNAIDPRLIVNKYGLDALRYYLLREITFGYDGDFSEKRLMERINSDLANDLGNLVLRTLAMIEQNFNSRVSKPSISMSTDESLKELALETIGKFFDAMDSYKFTDALTILWKLIKRGNKYIDETEPWLLAKDASKKERLGTVLYNLAEVIRIVALLLKPIMPDTSYKIYEQLGIKGWEDAADEALKEWGMLKVNSVIHKGKPLFPRLDIEKEERVIKLMEKKKGENLVTIEDFKKLDMRVAKIERLEKIPNADKLFRLEIDVGPLGKRQLVAGLAKYYTPEELVGKKIVIIANLKPARIFGLISNGMLLASEDGKHVKVLTVDDPEDEVAPGAVIG
ncbi:MAG: methionine--tRNA ligase [Thermotogae bacterium]|nr:methionine--tRNA ligase [Thermotogota bacterium]